MRVFIINFINILFQALSLAVLIRVLLSWVRIDPYNRFVQILYQITDPILKPFQRIIPPIGGMLDISPIVALLVLQLVQNIVITMLSSIL